MDDSTTDPGGLRELTGKRRHAEALDAAEALPDALRAHVDVIYLTAVNQRYVNRISDALETLRRLEQQDPRFSRLYQERGHCYATLGDATRAIEAFRQAVTLNPELPTSWHMLERLYRMTGDAKSAAAAAIEALRLSARIQHQRNMLSEAERLLETALRLAPGDTATRLAYDRVRCAV